MRCIFCKLDSSKSKSREHIIPESLWNTEKILDKGIVCDRCNNYFSREVEKPFLDSPALTHLRFNQLVPNKRGRVPTILGMISPGIPAVLHRTLSGETEIILDVPFETFEKMKKTKNGVLRFPASGEMPHTTVISRFLAKIGVEAFAQRIADSPAWLEEMVDYSELDPIRQHARTGHPKEWKYHFRTIYEADKSWTDETGTGYQIVHEYDFLQTDQDELYFTLALFGLEFTINMGGPNINGFLDWLKANDGISPLYQKK